MTAQPWALTEDPAGQVPTGDLVTTIDGSTFCITDHQGRMVPGYPHGLFVRDIRLLSHWELLVDGVRPEPLAVRRDEPYASTFLGRVLLERTNSMLLVVQRHFVGGGMRIDLEIRNVGVTPADCTVTVAADTDFADLFQVKEGRLPTGVDVHRSVQDGTLTFHNDQCEVSIRPAERPTVEGSTVQWHVTLPPKGRWTACTEVHAVVAGTASSPSHPCGEALEHAVPARTLREWRDRGPELTTADPELAAVLRRSVEDLGALRMIDPDHPDQTVVAAGAPWFMALFGRDSLLTSWMLLPLDQRLALGTLRTLAEHQGTTVNPATEEEPGRILHEMRFGTTTALLLGGGSVYYGTADATPLFVMLLDEMRRWGLADEEVDALLPHADRALEWVEHFGDVDGDGFVEYERATERGLANQGWKDSWDGINFADGRIAEAPIAPVEVQGYVYAAYLARADLAEARGDRGGAEHWTGKAAEFKRAFNETFWLPDRGWFAVGLDGDKRPIDALASNMGHCLWTGVVDDDKAPAVAEHLMSEEMFSGWGIRTLATSMGAYNPMSYHNGSVWPHDNALCAAGLMRYGFVAEAQRVAVGVLDTAGYFDHRLPELFCGFSRHEFDVPVPYPTSCSPQAWAAATPLSLLRTLLRFDPQVPEGRVRFVPAVPDRYLPLQIRGLRVGRHEVTIDVTDGEARIGDVEGLDVHSG